MGETWEVGTEHGFMTCYRATVPQVYRYAAMLCGSDRAAAEDLVQDVYLTALRKARDGQVATLTASYLTTAVRHRFLDRVRAEQREQARLRLVTNAPDDEPLRSAGLPLLADLSERERAAVVLRYVDDLTVAQVGEAMGVTTHAAESLLARALRHLRRQEVRDA